MSNVAAKLIIFFEWILILFWFSAWWIFVSFFCDWEISLSSFLTSETTCDIKKNLFLLFFRLVIPIKPPWIFIFLFSAHLHGPNFLQSPEYYLFGQKNVHLSRTVIYLVPFSLMLTYLINKLVAFCNTWFCWLRWHKFWFLQLYLDALINFLIGKHL